MKLRIIYGVLAAFLLTACGQAGNLYLPDKAPDEAQKREQQEKQKETQ